MTLNSFDDLHLGRQVDYPDQYSPGLLTSIPRSQSRQSLGLKQLPFTGEDIWNAYELSWLNSKGKPQVATAEFHIPCDSSCIIESKSFKLYLNSFNQTVIDSADSLLDMLHNDLSACAGASVRVELRFAQDWTAGQFKQLPGYCIDELDISTEDYLPDASLLQLVSERVVSKTLHSHLLRSLCPVTAQPDWASVLIQYRGAEISDESLLKYLVSYRKHQGFHEQCVEKIFIDLQAASQADQLTVAARFTRRGGIDINPVRSTDQQSLENWRLFRQ